MSCNNCSTTINSVPKGCKSNGSCASGGCEKLSVFDWLGNMSLPTGQKPLNIVEVRFKNGRKSFYKNIDSLPICMGDVVAVEGNPGHDIGTVSLTGELVKIQLKHKGIKADNEEIKKIYRKATQKDIEIWNAARDKEFDTQCRGREIIGKLGLKMKLSDVEYQGDGNKATFYYTADDRVDFRQLIKDLAGEFNIRIEMKQVGLRQEAARLGGIGSCGRELCCSTWLTDLRKVNTSAARYQQLSLNPQKLAGQCGKLKCCLNYELDTYLEALKDFPKVEIELVTEKGNAVFVKMDVFKNLLWYTYQNDRVKWYKLTLEQVNEIIKLNKSGQKVTSLEDYELDVLEEVSTKFENVVGQDSLTRFDVQKRKKKQKNKNKSKKNKQPEDRLFKQVSEKQQTENKTSVSKQKLIKKQEASIEHGTTANAKRPKRKNKRRPPKKNTNTNE